MRRILVGFAVLVILGMPSVAGSGIKVVPKPPMPGNGYEIIGYGKDHYSANLDAIRQIQQVFGRHHIISESIVRNNVLEKDEIQLDTGLTISRLDRFYQGTYRDGKRFVACFRFPKEGFIDLIADVRVKKEVPRMAKKKVKQWKVPEPILRFIDFFVWDIR